MPLTLKELRTKKKISQKAMADFLDVSQSAICLYETGQRKLPVEKAKLLETRFSVPWYSFYESTSESQK